jgi:hypothetical protein
VASRWTQHQAGARQGARRHTRRDPLGVGGAIAQKFAREGFFVVLTTRHAANAAALEKAIGEQDHHKSHHNARRDAMAGPVATELHTKTDAAQANLFRQLDGPDAVQDGARASTDQRARVHGIALRAEQQNRQARIPLFKQFMQKEETPIAVYVGALFDYHWNDHAGQLGKIRKAAGL